MVSKMGVTPFLARAGYAKPTIASKLVPVKMVCYFSTFPNF
jgi:hypothetical protein